MTQANDNDLFNNKMYSSEPNFHFENQIFLYEKAVRDDTLVGVKIIDDETTNHARNEKKIYYNKEKYNLPRFSSTKIVVRIRSPYNAMKTKRRSFRVKNEKKYSAYTIDCFNQIIIGGECATSCSSTRTSCFCNGNLHILERKQPYK
jgi:hypothetical protein